MTMGTNIRRLRQDKGWTQGQLSERSGIKVPHISSLEQDEGDPKLSTLYKLMHAFGCTPNALLMDPVQIREADALLHMVFDRALELRDEDKDPLIEVLDKYCVACEMQSALSAKARLWDRARSIPKEPEPAP
jgi:transcriptional regulator with XRE-family HTH domain